MFSGLHLKADARRLREKNRKHPAMVAPRRYCPRSLAFDPVPVDGWPKASPLGEMSLQTLMVLPFALIFMS
jgi:hypothetical protein